MNAKLYSPFSQSNIINVGFIIGNYTLPEGRHYESLSHQYIQRLRAMLHKKFGKCILKMDPWNTQIAKPM